MRPFLAALAVCLAVIVPARADADDPVKAKLAEAKQQYREQVERLRKNVLDTLEKKEAAARENGDKKAVDQIKADREAFLDRDVVPKSAGASDYSRDLSRFQAIMVSAFESAVKGYTKASKDAEAAKVEEELKAFKKEIVPKRTKPTKQEELLGSWEGQSGSGGFTEIWTIKKDDGKWSVKGIFKKGDEEVGAFHGQDYKYVNGALLFRQIYDKKPVSSWADGTILGCTAGKDKMVFRWQNPGSAAGPPTILSRVKE
jgi:hypothetical protein